jgi:hypothetical protein
LHSKSHEACLKFVDISGASGDGCSSACTIEPLTGLLQKCGNGLPACPANAPLCFGLVQGGTSYCSPACVVNGTGTTNAQGQFANVNPAPNNQTCMAAYTGGVGMPQCAVIVETVPADMPLQPNKAYTGITFGCAVACGAGQTCPAGNTCNTGIGPGLCLPQ